MGAVQAAEMAALADRETALRWHLQSNHYPPIPAEMIPVAIDAIEAAEDGDWDAQIPLMGIVEWRGRTEAPVWALVEHMHLDAFIR